MTKKKRAHEVCVCVKIYFDSLIVKLCYILLLEIRIPSLWPRTMTNVLAFQGVIKNQYWWS